MGEFTDRITRWGLVLITVFAVGVWLTVTAETATGASISQGQTLFASSGCAGCHDGGQRLQGKNLTIDQIVAALNPGGSMASQASGLTSDQKLSIACYVKSAYMGGIPAGETRCPATPTTTAPPSTTSSTTATTAPSTTSSTTATTSPSTTSSTTTTTTASATTSTTSSTTTTTVPAPAAVNAGDEYDAGPAGEVYLDVVDGRLVLAFVKSSWTWMVKENEGDEIEIFFFTPGRFVKFEAELEDGTIETEVVVRGRPSGHDDEDERRSAHDDDDDHDDGGDHDDD